MINTRKSCIFAISAMPQPIDATDGSVSNSCIGSSSSFRQTSTLSSTGIASASTTGNAELSAISFGRSSRKRQPSRKFLENAATEALVHQENPSKPIKRRDGSSSRPPTARKSNTTAVQSIRQSSSPTQDGLLQRPLMPSIQHLNTRRASQKTALESCNFTSFISVNEHFKAHKGKGSYNVPRHLLDQCSTDKAKAKCVKEW